MLLWKRYLRGPLPPLLVEIEIRVHQLSYIKFNSGQFSFETFFYIIVNFCFIQPWSEPIFSILVKFFQKWQVLDPPLLLPSLLGEKKILVYWLICIKFNSGQLSFKTFFDIIGKFAFNPEVKLFSHSGALQFFQK